MTTGKLANIKVAAIMTDGFEQIEFVSPRNVLENEGATVEILAPKDAQESGKVQGWNHMNPGDKFDVDKAIEEADPEDYDAVLLPGGVINADKLRVNEAVKDFLRHINDQNKPIFVICHGAWSMISAGIVRGRRMTSYHTIKDDLKNAGAIWIDEPVVEDDNIISSRSPSDLVHFNAAIVEKSASIAAEQMAQMGSASETQ